MNNYIRVQFVQKRGEARGFVIMILFALVGVALLIVGALRAKNNPKVLWLVGLGLIFIAAAIWLAWPKKGLEGGYVSRETYPFSLYYHSFGFLNERIPVFPNVHRIEDPSPSTVM